MTGRETSMSVHRVARASARALGWFSLGLGAAELLAPNLMGRVMGLADRDGLLRLYGLREIASGLGIIATTRALATANGHVEYEISDTWVELPNAADAVLGHDADAGSNALLDPPPTAADAMRSAPAAALRAET